MWTKEQTEAIYKSGTNIIVSAGAGSGKTAVLSERVIKKLEKGININELLILTFTKAAASEMKERIRKKIKKNETLKEQLSLIDSAYITTFDSYALSLVKKYHYILNIGKDVSIVNESIIRLEKEKVLDEIFEELYKIEDKKFLNLISTFCTKDDNEIRKYIMTISSKIDLIIDKDRYLNNYIDNIFNKEKIKQDIKTFEQLILNKIKELQSEIDDIRGYVTIDFYDKLLLSCENLLKSISYDEVIKNLNIKLPQLRNVEEEAKTIKENISNKIKEIKVLCSFNSNKEIEEAIISTKEYIEIIIDIIIKLNKKLYKYKKKHNVYEFNDIELLAIKLLKENPTIKEEVKDSFNEILLDEYQDTSDIQEVFINLIAKDNVYMVGDIKQSIYRFRNANPSIFKNKYDLYKENIGGIKIDLNKNFRSRSEVINNINTIFNVIMTDFLGGADYISSHQMIFGNTNYNEKGTTQENYNLEIYNYPYDKTSELTKDEIEAFIICQDIKEKINNHYQIYDKDENIIRDIKYSDIVVLLDRSSNFDLYKKIFTYNNIPLMILKDEKMINEEDILVIKNILAFILKISNGLYDKEFEYLFTSIARSFIYKLSDEEIYNIVKNKKIKESNLYIKCKNLSKNINSTSLSKLFEDIIKEFDYYNKIITIGNIENILVKLDKLFELVDSSSSLGYTASDFVEYLNDCIENGYDISYGSNSDNTSSVKIMTIHKSKGLEYHLCYYANLYKEFNIGELKEKFLFDNKYGFVVPYFDEGIASTIYKELVKNDYIKDEISEKIRLFYVALTRAKEKMIIISPADETKPKNMINTRSFKDIIDILGNTIKQFTKNISLEDINITKDYDHINSTNIKNLINKSNIKLDIKEIEENYQEVKEDKFSKSAMVPFTKEEYENIEYGKKVHYILECADFINPEKEEEFVRKFLKHDIFNNIRHAKIYKEYEFIYEKEKISYHGIIDLMLIYDNYVDIIDYKLSNISDENYLKQLRGYKEYIELKTKKKVNIYLYSIISNTLHKLN